MLPSFAAVTLALAAVDVVDVTFAPADFTFAAAVSGDGAIVVGQHQVIEGEVGPLVWRVDEGVIEAPFSLGGTFTSLSAIATDGATGAGVGFDASGVQVGFVVDVDSGAVTVLADAPGGSVLANVDDISADGSVVVGASCDDRDDFVAVRWDNGVLSVLGTLSSSTPRSDARAVSADGSVVVGGSPAGAGASPATHSFVQRDGGPLVDLGDLPGGSDFMSVVDVSADDRVIVGSSSSALSGPNALEAFVITGDFPPDPLGALGDTAAGVPFASDALAVSSPSANPTVVIVGRSVVDVDENEHAFVWTGLDGMQDLNTLVRDAGLDLDGFVLAQATDVTDDATAVVGMAVKDGVVRAFRVRLAAPPPIDDGIDDGIDDNVNVDRGGCASVDGGLGAAAAAAVLLRRRRLLRTNRGEV